MKNASNLVNTWKWGVFFLFYFSANIQSQTTVKLLISQPAKLEITPGDLYSETESKVLFGNKVSVTGGASPYQYVWTNAGVQIGTSLSFELPKSTPLNSIVLTVKDANNCSASREAKPLGTPGIDGLSKIKVYPIPALKFIDLEPCDTGVEFIVSLFDSKGRLLLQRQITGKYRLDIDFPSGMYFLKIEDFHSRSVEMVKIVVL